MTKTTEVAQKIAKNIKVENGKAVTLYTDLKFNVDLEYLNKSVGELLKNEKFVIYANAIIKASEAYMNNDIELIAEIFETVLDESVEVYDYDNLLDGILEYSDHEISELFFILEDLNSQQYLEDAKGSKYVRNVDGWLLVTSEVLYGYAENCIAEIEELIKEIEFDNNIFYGIELEDYEYALISVEANGYDSFTIYNSEDEIIKAVIDSMEKHEIVMMMLSGNVKSLDDMIKESNRAFKLKDSEQYLFLIHSEEK